MKVIGYARVFTDDQVREGVSLDSQEARIRAFCEAKGWELASICQWERRVIGERTAAALAHLRAQGRRVSRFAPYGYRLAPGGRLRPDVKEQAVLGRIAALRGRGLSLRAISRTLAEQGIVARNGRPFAPKVLLALVTNRAVGNSAVAS